MVFKRTPQEKEKFLATMRENRRKAVEGSRDIYKESLKDMKFLYEVDEGQWGEDSDNTVQITANNLLKFVRQIRADARQNRPRLKVVPVDDAADVEKAKLYNGLFRQIEHLSSADIAYDTAYMQCVSGSIGYFRVVTQFENERSFDLDVRIERIRNPYTVRFDPSAKKFNKEDAKFALIDDWMTKEDFRGEHPDADMAGVDSDDSGQQFEGWFEKDRVRVAEYYYKKKRKFTLARIKVPREDGSFAVSDEELTPELKEALNGAGGEVVSTRPSFEEKVFWAKVSGNDILEETEWAGKFIPIILIQGDEIVVDGKTHLLSVHRGAHDLQRMLNFWISEATKAVALIPNAPYIIDSEQIEGHEKQWKNAHKSDLPVLVYNSVAGLAKPSRERPPDAPIGILQMIQVMSNGIEDHLNMTEALQGRASNERSGVAIQRRIAQSSKGTFAFVDNYARGLIYCAKQIVDLIPKIYDTERAIQIRGEDGSSESQVINQNTGEVDELGRPILENDLSIGKFDLIETIAASTVSRRAEEVENIKSSMQFAGPFAPALIPLLFKFMDSPNADEIQQAVKDFAKSQQQTQQ